MPFLEIYRGGRLYRRQEVDPQRAAAGLRVRLGKDVVLVSTVQPARNAEWEAKIVDQPSPESVAPPEEPAPHLPGYELIEQIGEGGMGVVWKGVQLSTKRHVAIKFLSTRAFGSERSRQRFEREVELCAKLEHPNIARIYDSGLHHGVYFYAMELIRGLSLEEYARQHDLGEKSALELMRAACRAVQHAHERGVVHRDLKPANILVSDDAQPHVLDFGLAKSLLLDEADKQLTISIEGAISGTPAYMSPEQAAGRLEQVDSRTDVYSLGVILYRLVVGQPPHNLTGSQFEVMRRIIEEDVRSPRALGASIDGDLEAILLKSLSQRPENRYATAGDLAADIDHYLQGEPIVARRPTALYLFRKRLKRHRAATFFTAGVLCVALVFGVLPGGWLRELLKKSAPIALTVTVPNAVRVSADAAASKPSRDAVPATLAASMPIPLAPRPTVMATTALTEIAGPQLQKDRSNPPATSFASAAGPAVAIVGPSTASAPTAVAVTKNQKDTLDLGGGTEMQLVSIPAGKFMMGSPNQENGHGINESPRHPVTISRPFRFGKFEVTRIEFAAFVNATNYRTETETGGPPDAMVWVSSPGGWVRKSSALSWRNADSALDPNHPIFDVSWKDATAFCQWASTKSGRTVRLPTEAEWEYACRAGTTTPFWFGDDFNQYFRFGNYADRSSDPGRSIRDSLHDDGFANTAPVGSFPANPWGLCDMHGNVAEWCRDFYAARYPSTNEQVDPPGPAVGTERVVRGGSWNDSRASSRSAARKGVSADTANSEIGFRVVVMPAPGEASPAKEPAFYAFAPTPPMGWNSYDAFGDSVNEAEVLANANYVKDHLLAHGWTYVVVDFRWSDPNAAGNPPNGRREVQLTMDANGRLLPAPDRFPSAAGSAGFGPLARQIHAMGLKFGIHIMRGIPREAVKADTPIEGSGLKASEAANLASTCKWCPDMFGVDASKPAGIAYYDSLMRLYAGWGVDYLKVDDLSAPYSSREIEAIRDAIDRTGRAIVFSASPGPTALQEADHIKTHANLWRVSGDFLDQWDLLDHTFDAIDRWSGAAGPGHWPDADIVPLGHIGNRSVGNPRRSRFTHDEQITLLSLWSLAPSPLMLGGYLPDNDDWDLSLITNDAVLAINQDPLARPALRIVQSGKTEAWIRDLSDGGKAVGLFNRGESNAGIPFPWMAAHLAGTYTVRDVWSGSLLSPITGPVSMTVPKHGAVLLRIAQKSPR